ncbi:MAG: transketolase [bacterium]|nr:transketolase [bacterium]
MTEKQQAQLALSIRRWILQMTTAAGTGHATSSLSATDLMAALFFGGFFRADVHKPQNPNNDRIIFSKGHAAPLLYALYAAAGVIPERELLMLRKFSSRLEGHPIPSSFPYAEAATGSLGQGLSVGLGMALAARIDKLPYRTFVLLGDSELAEGQIWEAAQLASHYKLNNLITIADINRLGQRGATMLGWNVQAYAKRFAAFGWRTFIVDGHNLDAIAAIYRRALTSSNRPTIILAKTVKGKGVSFLENKNGWHGKALTKVQLAQALAELGEVQRVRGFLAKPLTRKPATQPTRYPAKPLHYTRGTLVATRAAYGSALARIAPAYPELIVLDAETSNSTMADTFSKAQPKRFYEMFIAEQNMVSTALGLARRGKIPFASTFAAFLTRAHDQIRMAALSDAHIVLGGSHAGVSIGQDGASQMGVEDIAMFRSTFSSTILYPSDAVSTEKLVEQAAKAKGIVYIRTTRGKTPVLYNNTESFPIGGSKTLAESRKDKATIIAAGITVHEAAKAYNELLKRKINVRVIDLYSIKPIDRVAILRAARQTKHLIVVEDHVAEGGVADAVREVIGTSAKVTSLAVRKIPRSGKPEQLLAYEGIDAKAIVRAVKQLK